MIATASGTTVGGALCVSFAGMSFSLDGLDAEARAAVARRFGARPDVGQRALDGVLWFSPAAPCAFPAVDTTGYTETFTLDFVGPLATFSGRLARGTLDRGRTPLHVRIECAPAAPEIMLGVVENVLRIATAHGAAPRGALLVHSAAIAVGDVAILLVGRSGAGKSTASAAAQRAGRHVLSDELNLVVLEAGRPLLAPVPFAGDFGEPPQEARYSLAGIFLLAQGVDAVLPVSVARAAATLLAAAPFINADSAQTEQLLQRAEHILAACPARELSLRLGSDPWAVAWRQS